MSLGKSLRFCVLDVITCKVRMTASSDHWGVNELVHMKHVRIGTDIVSVR